MCVLWFGARQVIEGKLTAGELSAFVVYAVFVSGNVGSLAGVFSSLIQVLCRAPTPHSLLPAGHSMKKQKFEIFFSSITLVHRTT